MSSVQVLPGPGMVARFGDVLLWIEEGKTGGAPVIANLLDLARALADSGDDAQVGGKVAEALNRDPTGVPAMVLVAPAPGGLRAIVHGWGRVLADGVDIDGGWSDRQLAWTAAFAAGRGGDLLRVPAPDSVLDLRRGSTPGGGAAVTLAPQGPPRPDAEAETSERGGEEESATTLLEAATSEPPPARAPSKRVHTRAAPAQPEGLPIESRKGADGEVTVKGVACHEGHFNNPAAVSCGTCGTDMGEGPRILRDGIRPSLGSLVLDDGTTFALDRDHLIGTEPQRDPSVAAGPVRPVPLDDPSGQVAAVHAEVRLVDWDVLLVARAPTFVLRAGAQQWSPAPPGQPSPVPAGATIALGPRTMYLTGGRRGAPPPGPPSP